MQIVIPMSGFGERFRNAWYRVPKPLIKVEGKPIIEHVIDMFPGETNIIFICNRDHLNDSSFSLFILDVFFDLVISSLNFLKSYFTKY